MVWQQENRILYEDFLERYRIVLIVLLIFFLVLAFRLFFLQVVRGKYYKEISEQQRTQVIVERAPRGVIYDCSGNIIVGSKSAFAAIFYPFAQTSVPTAEVLNQLKLILNKDLGRYVTRGWRSGQAVRLAGNLTRAEMFRLQEKRLVLPGISVVKESIRDYSSPVANSHLVGYINEINNQELENLSEEGYSSGDWMGRGGLEQNYNSILRGQNGGWQIEVDALGRQTRIVRYIPPTIGSSLHTTIDSELQNIISSEFEKTTTGRGAAVVLDVKTGAVKALVSAPGFDPAASLSKGFGQYLKDKQLPLYNRAVQALYAPGSTFKIVTFSAAVAEGNFDPQHIFTCHGQFVLGNKTFKCWYKKGHGPLTLIPALANSCNVYFYQTGLKTGPVLLEKFARAFHLGEKTGVDIPSEKKGLVPSGEWKQKKMHEAWQQGDTVNVAIGQGPLWVTPFQMAVLISGVANKGTFYKPYIVDAVTNPSGEVTSRTVPVKLPDMKMPDASWDLLMRGLEEAVVNGTGRGCYFPNLKVAGKTGTAQNPHGVDHAWFVSYAPADDPKIAVAVIVENGGHGGTAAVPIVRKIYESYFGLNKPKQASTAAINVSTSAIAAVQVQTSGEQR